MRPRSILVGLILVLMLAYSVAVYVNVIPLRRSLVERGWNAAPRAPDGAEAVERVDPEGAAAGLLQVGDEIIALNGEPVEYSDEKMESAYGRVERGGAVDERSDIFSIGVMVVEAITGRRPFTGTTYHELLTNILNASYHLEDASPAARELDAALRKSLAKDRGGRYPTAAAMQQELIPALRRQRQQRPEQEQQRPPSADQEAAAVTLDADTHILKAD